VALHRVITIGVYGFTSDAFFSALVTADVDLFCDLRARRGLRGRDYAFANSQRLQARLRDLGIRYLHFPELAPTTEIRSLQHGADSEVGVAKRERVQLGDSFMTAYLALLTGSPALAALDRIASIASVPALFCVERMPSACHRSLVAECLARDSIPIEHLVP
jgi:uncharacterized protein (DUF488 family)